MNPVLKLVVVVVVAALPSNAREKALWEIKLNEGGYHPDHHSPPIEYHGQVRELEPWEEKLFALENMYRSDHHVPLMEYNAELSAGAQEWADNLARHCLPLKKLNHSSPELRPFQGSVQGENLYRGVYKETNSAPEAGYCWYREIKDYPWGTGYEGGGVNSDGEKIHVGHFTQQIWAETRMVGYGMARCQHLFVVARYFPPGNVMNHYHDNVLPL